MENIRDRYGLNKVEAYVFGITILLLLCSLFFRLGDYPLKGEEPRRAFVAMEMIFRGNFIVPTQMGGYYYGKPPFYNWLLIVAFKLFGNYSEFSMRFVSMVSLLITAFLIFRFSKKQLGARAGIYAAFFYIINVHILFYFSFYGEIDLFYILITFLALYSVYHFESHQKFLELFVITYAITAIGFLTKGFPSIVFSGLTLTAYLLIRGQFKVLFSWQHVLGVVLFIVITGTYFFVYDQLADAKGYITNLFHESTNRTVLHGTYIERFWVHIGTYPLETLMYMFPSSLFFVFLFNEKTYKTIKSEPFALFAFTVLAVNFPIYWFSPGASERYVAPLYPFAAILFTTLLFRCDQPSLQKFIDWIIVSLIGLLGAGSIYLFFNDELNATVSMGILISVSISSVLIMIFLIYFYRKFTSSRILIFFIILVWIRFISLYTVIPVRAENGRYVKDKEIATRILEITAGQPLQALCIKTIPSKGIIYYLERRREVILNCENNIEPNTFFLVNNDDLPNIPYHSYYSFTDSNKVSMQLVKFND